MPPRKSDARKSDVSAAAPAADASQITVADESVLSTAGVAVAADKSITEGGGGSSSKKSKDASAADDKTTIEDLTLPKSIITRLAKGVLPANTQIQGNAILAMSKSTTVFINYLAAHANEITLNANKKTIMPADVFKALEEIEFDFLKEPLEAEFAKFNAIQTEKRNTYRQKVKATKTPGDDTDMGGDASMVADTTTASAAAADDDDGDDDGAPRSKKARVEASGGADAEETEVDEDGDEDAAEEMDDEEEDEEEVEDEEEEEEEEGAGSGDETQDALEERADEDEADEALDGDESD